ncbi:MAG: PorP/SprF family type IX secretion system membrane protein [Flavobacteriales bacterium]|nr:PorP/SprF family type IX secretion system membrane protein [Flavobacteriales bacterium]
MKKVLFGITILLLSSSVYGQQDAQWSLNTFNRLTTNPGVAGSNNAICANLLGRNQWVQFDGRPATYQFSVHGPLSQMGVPIGLGLTVSQDQIGRSTSLGSRVAVAYQKGLGPGTIGIGVAGGIISYKLGAFTAGEAIDDPANDPTIPTTAVSSVKGDFDLGIYYKIPNQLYVGFSSTHLNQADLNVFYEVKRHYYIIAGYEKIIGANLVLKPNVWIKSDAASAQIDINLLAELNNMILGGVSYRYQDAVVLMAGLKMPLGPGNAKLMYAYDINTSQLRSYNSGSHEILLGYCFNIKNSADLAKHVNPRFMHAE